MHCHHATPHVGWHQTHPQGAAGISLCSGVCRSERTVFAGPAPVNQCLHSSRHPLCPLLPLCADPFLRCLVALQALLGWLLCCQLRDCLHGCPEGQGPARLPCVCALPADRRCALAHRRYAGTAVAHTTTYLVADNSPRRVARCYMLHKASLMCMQLAALLLELMPPSSSCPGRLCASHQRVRGARVFSVAGRLGPMSQGLQVMCLCVCLAVEGCHMAWWSLRGVGVCVCRALSAALPVLMVFAASVLWCCGWMRRGTAARPCSYPQHHSRPLAGAHSTRGPLVRWQAARRIITVSATPGADTAVFCCWPYVAGQPVWLPHTSMLSCHPVCRRQPPKCRPGRCTAHTPRGATHSSSSSMRLLTWCQLC